MQSKIKHELSVLEVDHTRREVPPFMKLYSVLRTFLQALPQFTQSVQPVCTSGEVSKCPAACVLHLCSIRTGVR